MINLQLLWAALSVNNVTDVKERNDHFPFALEAGHFS